jgi:hypothetical protein
MAIIDGGSTSSQVQVSTGAGRAVLYDTAGNPMVFGEADTYSVSTSKGILNEGLDHDTIRPMAVSRDGRLEVPSRRLLFSEFVEGATLNTQKWTSTATTMTAVQAAATGIQLNGSAITTINTGIALSSRSTHLRVSSSPLHFRARMRSTAVANQEWMAGLAFQSTLSGTAVIDTGAIWKFGTDGTLKPALWLAGAEVALGTDISGSVVNTNYYDYHVIVDDDRAIFQVFRSDTGVLVSKQTLRLALTTSRLFGGFTHLYTYVRLRNSGSAPSSAGQIWFTEVDTIQTELVSNVPYQQTAAGLILGSSVNPTAYTQAAQFANSAAPASAVLSNTAASYTTLGGLWQFAALAGATTDFCLFGYTVPSPYRFWMRGIRVDCWNTGAANAATPATTCLWGVGVNGASANLSTGGHIRRSLGQTTIPINAAIGASCNSPIDIRFKTPMVCEPGTNLAIILRVVAGAVTASQIIQGSVDIDGDFE